MITMATNLNINVSANVSGATSTLNALDTRIDRTKGRAIRMLRHIKQMDVYAFRTFGYISSILVNAISFVGTVFEFVIGGTNILLSTTLSVVSTIASTFYLVSAAMTSGGATAYLGVVMGIASGAMQIASSIMIAQQKQSLNVMLNYTQSMFNDLSMMMRF